MEFLQNAIPSPVTPELVRLISSASQSLRKQLITIARYGDIAHGKGSFFRRTQEGYQCLRDLFYHAHAREYRSSYSSGAKDKHEYVDTELRNFLSNPLIRGYIISLCTTLPITPEEVAEEKVASFAKEINVMDREGFNPEFDFSAFFGDYERPVHPQFPVNEKMAETVHCAIEDWLTWLEGTVLNVTMSRKLLPTHDINELKLIDQEMVDEKPTQGTLERLRIESGITLANPCEVSQRWYVNQQTPRTYFVAGSRAFESTKFTKEMWNRLVDSLSVCHRKSRVNPNRIRVRGLKKVLFYDLTSFTSNMRAQREFLKELGIYCSERYTTIRDTVTGIIENVPISEIIRQYNEMNTKPEYRVNKGPFEGLHGTHGPAGFLGVIGNIATCNFLHGALLLQFVDNEDECGCAGDDAVIVEDHDNDDDAFFNCISLAGILALEKVYSSEDIDVVYLKRRTWIDEHRGCLRSSAYIQCPSLLPFIPWRDDLRFRERHMSRREIVFLASESLKATFRSAQFLRNADVQDYTRFFLLRYYKELNFNPEGYLPQVDREAIGKKVPSYPAISTIFSEHYLEETGMNLYNGYVRLSDRGTKISDRLRPKRGMTFRSSKSSIHMRLLERLGYIKKRGKPKVAYYGDDGYARLLDELARKQKWERLEDPVYIYECVKTPVTIWMNEAWDINGEILDYWKPPVLEALDLPEDVDSDIDSLAD